MKKKYRFALYLAIIIITLFIYGVLIYETYYPPLKPIERLLHTTIPHDASDIQADYQWGFQGGIFYLQFKLPPESFDEFKSRVCGEAEFDTEYNRWANIRWGTQPDWWLTVPTSVSVSTECLVASGQAFDLFVDKSNEQACMIYIRGSEG